jgi:hypothetical protein
MHIDNVPQILGLLVDKLDINVTKRSILTEVEKNPNYNTFLGISEILDNWKISNAAYYLDFKELRALEIQTPFIAHLSTNLGEFCLVSQFDNNNIVISNERLKNERLSAEQFKKIYNGAILIAEKAEFSGETDYKINKRREIVLKLRIPFIVISCLLIFSYIASHFLSVATFHWQITSIILIKIIGLSVSVLLLMQSLDMDNSLIQSFCTGPSNSCNEILSSSAAKITPELSWSEVGFFYFAGTWLTTLFIGNQQGSLHILAFFNLCSLPYTCYSIYYQSQVAKQWCMFCCSILILLWVEFILFFPVLMSGFSISLTSVINFVFYFGVPITLWVILKPTLIKATQITSLKQELREFKYNSAVFHSLLNEEVKYALLSEKHSIIWGNKNSKNTITMVTGPFCKSCAEAHKALNDLISVHNDIKLQMVFRVSDNETGPKADVANHLLALKDLDDDLLLNRAINDWFQQTKKNYQKWSSNYPLLHKSDQSQSLKKQAEWCEITESDYTPAFFINGRRLPYIYKPEDIKYLIQ